MSSPSISQALTAAPPVPGPIAGVTILRWPAQHDLRLQLAVSSELRLLMVAPEVAPPDLLDDREDWLREPVAPTDLLARARELRRRSDESHDPAPVVDADGLLRYGGRWAAVPDAQVQVVRLLVERIDRLVSNDEIATAYEAGGGSSHPNALRTLVARLRARFDELGLELVTIRSRGLLLATSPSSAGHPRASQAQAVSTG